MTRIILASSILISSLLISLSAKAYPDFIGYGYNNCMSCHYNSHGNGPLTDYGRALFSQEIAARNFWTSKSVDDQTIAQNSGFFPGIDLPYWIRPGLKYRGLWMQVNPGKKEAMKRWILMQRDVNLTLSLDPEGQTILTVNYGFLSRPGQDYFGNGKPVDAVSREHYIRFFPTEKLLVAAGLMDIVYGIRTGDHTSLSRGGIGLGQDSQVHGLLLQWLEENWDASLHVFMGNMMRVKTAQTQGVALQSEYLLGDRHKLGASFMTMSTKSIRNTRVAIHDRWGLPRAQGSSLLFELGLAQDEMAGKPAQIGAYGMIQTLIQLTRGFNIVSTIERKQTELKATASETSRWTLGFLTFPLQRTEARLTLVQTKGYSPTNSTDDSTLLQGQLHVSW